MESFHGFCFWIEPDEVEDCIPLLKPFVPNSEYWEEDCKILREQEEKC